MSTNQAAPSPPCGAQVRWKPQGGPRDSGATPGDGVVSGQASDRRHGTADDGSTARAIEEDGANGMVTVWR